MNTQPHPAGVRLLPWRVRPWVFDVVLISLTVIGSVRRPFSDGGAFEAVDGVALVVGIGVLLIRRRFTLLALVVSVGTSLVLVAVADRPSMLLPVTLAVLFTVGLQQDRRTAMIAGTAVTVLFGLMIIVLVGRGELDGAGLASIAWPAFATAAGVAVRGSRENLASAQDRAERAERTREAEAERRVVEERLRIARDVHDLVAHHIAVINVQAGVAGHLVEQDPDAAKHAVGVVKESAATAIDQLGELLNVLRTADDVHDWTSPTPDLDAIEDLISSYAASGLRVSRENSGARRRLTPSAELAAYRVVQEALTNAHKHGDGSAHVVQHFANDGLTIVVTNGLDRAADRTTDGPGGFGLVGMRERVEATGGDLVIDDASGDLFAVTAHFPAKDHT